VASRPPAVTNNQSGVTRSVGMAWKREEEDEKVELMRPKEMMHESAASGRVPGTDSV